MGNPIRTNLLTVKRCYFAVNASITTKFNIHPDNAGYSRSCTLFEARMQRNENVNGSRFVQKGKELKAANSYQRFVESPRVRCYTNSTVPRSLKVHILSLGWVIVHGYALSYG